MGQIVYLKKNCNYRALTFLVHLNTRYRNMARGQCTPVRLNRETKTV